VYYEVEVMDGNTYFFDAAKVTVITVAKPRPPPVQPGAPSSTSAQKAPAEATSAQNAPKAFEVPTSAQKAPAEATSAVAADAASTPAPAVAPQRFRKCKDCDATIPWVARITLCDSCGVQRRKPNNARDAIDGGDGESCGSSDSSSDDGAVQLQGGRKRARKFTPHKNELPDIFAVIASDCPYTHHRDSQKYCWKKAMKCLHKHNIAVACTSYRQLKTWCDKICEAHHKEVISNLTKSGEADDPKPTVLDTVACDWADYNLRTGKASKINKKHAEIIRAACVSTSRVVPDFAREIESCREKHNAVARTAAASQPRTSGGSASLTPLTSPLPAQRPTRATITDALNMVMHGAPAAATLFPTQNAEVVAEFAQALLERERTLYPHNFVSRLEQHVPEIMQTLGVQTIADFDELQPGQEDACKLPVLAMNRFKAVLQSMRSDPPAAT
jgi:hypothetical protein